MYKGLSCCILIPAYNEQKNILSVINSLPSFIDEIVVVNDCSNDDTHKILEDISKINSKVTIINKEINEGAGAAKKVGYLYGRTTKHNLFITMDGDGQMNPDEIKHLLDPIVDKEADFTKANRLLYSNAYKKIPKKRFFGNSILSLLTKIASGFWHVSDSQTGFTACNREVIDALPFEQLYSSYGYPNHLLVMLNINNFKVKDIKSEPIYGVGEKSNINIKRVIIPISWLLIKSFFLRLKIKYIINDFHPLVLFYFGGFFSLFISFLLSLRLFYKWYFLGDIPGINALATMFFGLIGLQLILFAMWFDMDINKELK